MKRSAGLRAVLSGNAQPGIGGQGLNLKHMIEGYAEEDPNDMHILCQGPYRDFPVTIVGQSPISRFVGGTPGLRRMRDFQVSKNEEYFDRRVAAHMPDCELFQGATGQCLKSLRRARQIGARTRLDVITTHVDVYHEEQTEECSAFGIRPTMSASQRRQMLEEYQEADEIRVMSDVVRKMFLDRGFDPAKVFTAHPPMDCDIPSGSESGGIPDSREPEEFIVGYAGLLEPAKGFHYLVKAFREFDDPRAQLHLWGGTGSRPVFEFMGKNMHEDPRIQIKPGSIRSLGYAKVYGQMSVYVHPSLADGFGYVVCEAMASGRPVIVTENTGAADMVQDGINGFIVPIRDSQSILEKLHFLRNSPEIRQKMGEAARISAQNLTLEKFRRNLRQAH